jgi:hypothetical protein
MKPAVTTSTKALLASFEISYLIATYKKVHTTGDTLLLPAGIKMCETLCENYDQALQAIHLSNNTVMRRI